MAAQSGGQKQARRVLALAARLLSALKRLVAEVSPYNHSPFPADETADSPVCSRDGLAPSYLLPNSQRLDKGDASRAVAEELRVDPQPELLRCNDAFPPVHPGERRLLIYSQPH